jgi:hypothetical protein
VTHLHQSRLPFRFPTSANPWQARLEQLDAVYETWPASERPLFPPNPSTVPGRDDARTASAVPLALALTAPAPASAAHSSAAPGPEHHPAHKD